MQEFLVININKKIQLKKSSEYLRESDHKIDIVWDLKFVSFPCPFKIIQPRKCTCTPRPI